MNNEDLFDILNLFKIGRKKILLDFLEASPEIFIPIFKYEDDVNMMNVSIEYWLLEWINYHFELFSKIFDISSPKYLVFVKAMSSLLESHMPKDKVTESGDNGFVFELMRDKQKILERIFTVNDKSELLYKKLLCLSLRDKALFKRMLESLKGG